MPKSPTFEPSSGRSPSEVGRERVELGRTPAETVACCAPLVREPLSVVQAEHVSTLLKALADPVRLRLMSLVVSSNDGEVCVCDLTDAFDLSQPTISHHLKVLYDAGLLEREKRSTWVYYRARAEVLDTIAALISASPGSRASSVALSAASSATASADPSEASCAALSKASSAALSEASSATAFAAAATASSSR